MRQINKAKDAGYKGTYLVLIPNSKELFGTQKVIIPIGVPYTTCGEYYLETDNYDEQNDRQLLTKGMVDNLPLFWQEMAVKVK